MMCLAGLILCWLIGFAPLGLGIYQFRRHPECKLVTLTHLEQELIVLFINVTVTACNDITGFIHTLSLRWALHQESKLDFNSNLRLFTSSRRSKANSWYINAFMAALMVLSYVSTPFFFIPLPALSDHYVWWRGYDFQMCGLPMIILAIALLGQALVATFCTFSSTRILTWSSDPVETTSACVGDGSLHHISGCCLRAVGDGEEDVTGLRGKGQQKSAYRSHRQVRTVTHWIWIPVALAFCWVGVIGGLIQGYKVSTLWGVCGGGYWGFFPHSTNAWCFPTARLTPSLMISWGGNSIFNSIPGMMLLLAVIQAGMTMSLHCAELIVNVGRDEASWRRAGCKGWSRSNALSSVLRSPAAILLFMLKAVIH
jgi:hypothetical protein